MERKYYVKEMNQIKLQQSTPFKKFPTKVFLDGLLLNFQVVLQWVESQGSSYCSFPTATKNGGLSGDPTNSSASYKTKLGHSRSLGSVGWINRKRCIMGSIVRISIQVSKFLA